MAAWCWRWAYAVNVRVSSVCNWPTCQSIASAECGRGKAKVIASRRGTWSARAGYGRIAREAQRRQCSDELARGLRAGAGHQSATISPGGGEERERLGDIAGAGKWSGRMGADHGHGRRHGEP